MEWFIIEAWVAEETAPPTPPLSCPWGMVSSKAAGGRSPTVWQGGGDGEGMYVAQGNTTASAAGVVTAQIIE